MPPPPGSTGFPGSRPSNWLPALAAALAFGVALAMVARIDTEQRQRQARESRNQALVEASLIRDRLKSAINQKLALAYSLSAYAAARPDMGQAEFHQLARTLVAQEPGIISIQLARDNVVSHAYPATSSVAPLGRDLLAQAELRSQVEHLQLTRRATVSGPLNLMTDGLALVGRNPVFLPARDGTPGAGKYWGLANVLMHVDTLFNPLLLAHTSRQFRFAVRGKNGEGAAGAMIWGDAKAFNEDPVLLEVRLPDGSWQIGARAMNDWLPPPQTGVWTWGSLAALVLAGLVWLLARNPQCLGNALPPHPEAGREISDPTPGKGACRKRPCSPEQARICGQADEALRSQAAAIEASGEMMVITDRDAIVQYINPAFTQLTGFSREEALGHPISSMMRSGTHPRDFYANLWQTILSGLTWRGEIINRTKSGQSFVAEQTIAPIFNADKKITGFVSVMRDISERKQLEARLEQMAHFDALTGLPNRPLFFDRLNFTMKQAKREQKACALLFIDLDGFKEVNDSLGHKAGDAVLREAALRIAANIRESDTAARMGGDEFTVILSQLADPEDSQLVARKLLTALAAPFAIPHGNCRISASIGISFYPEHGHTPETLLARADAAMYAAKHAGKNCTCAYGSGCQEISSELLVRA